jgi:hypothetical protein
MIVSRIFATATIAAAALAAIGCSSPQTSQMADATPAPAVVPAAPAPEPVMTAQARPAPLPDTTASSTGNDPSVGMTSKWPADTDSTLITERAPRADRN